MYLFISLVPVIVLIFVTLFPRLERFRKKHDVFLNFMLAISAAFAGVFLALYLTNVDSESKEKEKVIRLMDIAIEDLHNTAVNIGNFHAGIIDDREDDFTLSEFTDKSPRPAPHIFPTVLSNDLVLKWISPKTFSSLATLQYNMTRMLHIINNERIPNNLMKTYSDMYGKELYHAQEVLASEMLYLKKEITEEELEQCLQVAAFRKAGITPEDIDKAIQQSSNEKLDWVKFFKSTDKVKSTEGQKQ